MGAIKLTNFDGIYPRVSPRLLPDMAAQVALNCRLTNGELVPFSQPNLNATISAPTPFVSIYRLYENGAFDWFVTDHDVDVVKTPLFGKAKWVATDGDEPFMFAFDKTKYHLGVPAPVSQPMLGAGGGSGPIIDRYYTYTFCCEWEGVVFESAPAPVSNLVSGAIDGTWVISGMDPFPTNSGLIQSATYSGGYTTITFLANHYFRKNETIILGGTPVKVAEVVDKLKIKVAGNFSTASSWQRKYPFPGTFYRRIYRTGGTGGNFALVADKVTDTLFNDTLAETLIPGDGLVTGDWEQPPVGLKGVRLLPSGSLVGFIDNKIYFSEPYQPHAWRPIYSMQCDYPIVALEHFGTGIAVGTISSPYIITGVEPGQMRMERWGAEYPCLSKRSMCSIGEAVVYASTSGLISVNAAGASVWSLPFFTEREFSRYTPSTMISALAKGHLYVQYTANGTKRALVFNLMGDDYKLTEVDLDADDIFTDEVTGELFYSKNNKIYQFNYADGTPMILRWKSKEIVLPKATNIGAAKISFDTANGPVTFRLFVDQGNGETLKFTKTVADTKAFHLPSGFMYNSLTIEVEAATRIYSIELGGTKVGLASV